MPYKHDYDKILTRLTSILSKLNEGEHLSVKALAVEFNVSERTIQRDFNQRLVSFPIYQENKKWKMQDGHRIEKSTTLEEKIILDILETMTKNIGGDFSHKAHKLLGKIKNEDFNPIYTKLHLEDISDKLKEIQILEQAIKEKKVIHCKYARNKNIHRLSIEALKIANFEGFWYLIALDNKTKKLKKFYLKNLSHITITDKHFTVDKELDILLENALSVWFQKEYEPFEVKLYADASIAKYFKRKPLPTQKIFSSYEDGSIEFTVTITHEMEILPIIRYWIPHLVILEPQWIKEIIQDELQVYLPLLDEISYKEYKGV
ncbi:MAG: WYL domain-containing protein [Epsilonproteobacteria bacterium]|nr:WYL domain-containing protein [Campylobacterota bacterium]